MFFSKVELFCSKWKNYLWRRDDFIKWKGGDVKRRDIFRRGCI